MIYLFLTLLLSSFNLKATIPENFLHDFIKGSKSCGNHFKSQVDQSNVISIFGANDIESSLIHAVNEAQESIEMVFGSIGNQNLIDAINSKSRKGVTIKIIFPEDTRFPSEESREAITFRKALKDFKQSGVQVSRMPFSLMNKKTTEINPDLHQKILIIDKKFASVSTLTPRGFKSGNDFSIILDGPPVDVIRNNFLRSWMNTSSSVESYTFITQKLNNIKILSSYLGDLKSVKSTALKHIQGAKKSILIAQYWFNDLEIIEELINQKKKKPKLDLTIILNSTHRKHPILGKVHLNQLAFNRLSKENIKVLWSDMEEGTSFFHGKIMITDSEKVIVGSSDLTLRSFYANTELSLEITDKDIANFFEKKLISIMPSLLNRSIKGIDSLTSRMANLFFNIVIKANSLSPLTTFKPTLKNIISSFKYTYMKLFTNPKEPLPLDISVSKGIDRIKALYNTPLPKPTLKNKSKENNGILYVGLSNKEHQIVKSNGFSNYFALGDRGEVNGLYSTNNPIMGQNYAQKRSEDRNLPPGAVYFLTLKKPRNQWKIFNTVKDQSLLFNWFKEKYPNTPNRFIDVHSREILLEKGYDLILRPGAKAKSDFYVILDTKQTETIGYQDLVID